MKLYFSGASNSQQITEFMQKYDCCRLFSYYNDKNTIEQKICDDVFLDCGAWSAFTKNVEIDIDLYLEYLLKHKDCYSVSASLDVLPNNDYEQSAKDSFENYKYLKQRIDSDITLIPTYHRGEHVDSLKRLLNYNDVNYIGIGAVASNKSRLVRDNFLNQVFSVIHKERPDIKIHLFGLTDLSLLDKYPVYSADSTTWLMAGAMGEILTDYGRFKVSDKNYHIDSVKGFSDVEYEKLNDYVKKYGFTLEQLSESTENRQCYNIVYMKSKCDKISTQFKSQPRMKSLV